MGHFIGATSGSWSIYISRCSPNMFFLAIVERTTKPEVFISRPSLRPPDADCGGLAKWLLVRKSSKNLA